MTASESIAALAHRLKTNSHSPGDIYRAAQFLEQLAVVIAYAEKPK